MKKKLATLFALLLVLGACAEEEQPTVTATPVEEPAPEPEPEVEEVVEEIIEEIEEAEPEPPPEPDGMEFEEWAYEMQDTSEKMGSLLDLYSEVMMEGATGAFSTSEIASLSQTFVETVESHLSFWRNATPPPELTRTTDLIIASLEKYREAGTLMQTCVTSDGNHPSCNDAVEAMGEGARLTGQASEALP